MRRRAAAQTETIHRNGKDKIEIKDGKKVTIAGCLERNPGGGYLLTNEQGGMKYALVTDKDLDRHLDHLIAVHGKATDRGDARMKGESQVGTTGTTDDRDTDTKAKTELKGDIGLQKSCR